METIIRQIYAQWVIAKEQARKECESRSLHNVAEKYRKCNMFKGTERSIEELATVFTSRQGLEFCVRYRFPNIATFRLFKGQGVEKYGIYIDAGVITLNNLARAILIGQTSATINCNVCERHVVVLLHGARAAINASKWAFVNVMMSSDCSVFKKTSENAIII